MRFDEKIGDKSTRTVPLLCVLGDCEDTVNALPLKPFEPAVLSFFDELSKLLIKVRKHSDVATFGFWCRKASLLKELAGYDDLDARLGRGVVFHSTPSNVPVNFAFSFAVGLLAGNANIVRLPGKDFEQVSIIVDAIRKLLGGKHKSLAPYVCFVKYPPDRELHDFFSSVCDVRVIWGGDDTIRELRKSPLNPAATELTFADRYSIAVIDADEYLAAEDKEKIARDFYNDTYFSDQNACTSPRIVFWLGNSAETLSEAKKVFWDSLGNLAREQYELASVQAAYKLAAFYKVAAVFPVTLVGDNDNYVTRVSVTDADNELMKFKYNSGFFFEQDIHDLEDILPICGKRLQTLAYFGISSDMLTSFIAEHRPKGIDRIVPIGKTMDFSLVWDGYDLICELSKKIGGNVYGFQIAD